MEELLVILFCLFLNALLACIEMAFVTVRKSELKEAAKKGSISASKILILRERPERTLSIIQVGITLVGALAAAVGGAGAEEIIGPLLEKRFQLSENSAEFFSIILVILPVTYLNVVLGELVPKTFALKHSLFISLKAAKWLTFGDRFFSPLVNFLEWSTKKFLRIFSLKGKRIIKASAAANPISESEIVDLEDLSHQARQYVVNLASIENKRVKDFALPWNQVIFVQPDWPIDRVESIIISSGHTRMPVLKGKEIIGIINTKELLAIYKAGGQDWSGIIRPIIKFSAYDPLLKALKGMQEKRSHLGIVYSKNEILGIITIEDIIEEIIGDIFDEDDDDLVSNLLTRFRRSPGRPK